MKKRGAVLLAIFSAATTLVLAQGAPGRPPKPRNRSHIPMSTAVGPTPVSGDGTLTASGLRYWDIKSGVGAAAAKGKAVKIHYTGWLESGRKFDSSVDLNQPFVFVLGAGKVIKGWDEGIEGMRIGSKRQLRIPPYLAYGAAAPDPIPPNATLIYEVEVLGVQ